MEDLDTIDKSFRHDYIISELCKLINKINVDMSLEDIVEIEIEINLNMDERLKPLYRYEDNKKLLNKVKDKQTFFNLNTENVASIHKYDIIDYNIKSFKLLDKILYDFDYTITYVEKINNIIMNINKSIEIYLCTSLQDDNLKLSKLMIEYIDELKIDKYTKNFDELSKNVNKLKELHRSICLISHHNDYVDYTYMQHNIKNILSYTKLIDLNILDDILYLNYTLPIYYDETIKDFINNKFKEYETKTGFNFLQIIKL